MKICCGGFNIGTALKLIGRTLSVGSDNMSLTDAGLEVSTGAQGDSFAIGCVENDNEELVNGMRGTDDVYIYAGTDKDVLIGSDTRISGSATINGDIVGNKTLILNSSTVGSTKRFKITINDQGQITAEEIV